MLYFFNNFNIQYCFGGLKYQFKVKMFCFFFKIIKLDTYAFTSLRIPGN